MLQTQTVEARTLDLIKALMNNEQLKDFFLVGGTALSLIMGHRISIDIDLFTDKDFDPGQLSQHLQSAYRVEELKVIGTESN